MPFRFSMRWQDADHGPNPLTEAVEARKAGGKPILDLTITNPTLCGLTFPDWTSLLAQSSVQQYDPHPQGSLKAREAISNYYAERGQTIHAEDLFLTAGTSEGYSHLFKLLCDAGDEILMPAPSYPLLETLASLEGIQLRFYRDRSSLQASLTEKTRALIIVQPNNPTGSILSKDDVEYLIRFAEQNHLALVVDEVFADYCLPFDGSTNSPHRSAQGPALALIHSTQSLVFTLNGLSKTVGLPQLKLAWIHVDGNPVLKARAKEHLEWICDAYLSVNTASQMACPELLRRRSEFQTPIKERLQANLKILKEIAKANPQIEPLWPQGGWCIPVRCKDVEDDEAFAVTMVKDFGVLTQPGYFFDFEEENILVLSLLTPPETFREGLKLLASATLSQRN